MVELESVYQAQVRRGGGRHPENKNTIG